MLDHIAHPHHDIPHETPYEIPHEIKESVKLSSDWLNFIEHEQGTNHISDELRKNQVLQREHSGVSSELKRMKRVQRAADGGHDSRGQGRF